MTLSPPAPGPLPSLSQSARDTTIAAALEVVSKRSLPAIGALFDLVRRLDKRRTPQGSPCLACQARRMQRSPTLRVLQDPAATADQVLAALRHVRRVRDRDYAVQLLADRVHHEDERVRLAVLQALARFLDLRRAVHALILPSRVDRSAQVRRHAVQLLEQAGAVGAVIDAVAVHPGLRRYLRNPDPEHGPGATEEANRAEQLAAERRLRLRTPEGWTAEFRRLNGASPMVASDRG